MQRSRLIYLLTLSVLVNLGVLGAAVFHWRSGGAQAVDVAAYLQLDADQQRRWERLERPFVAELDAGWREVASHRERLIREMFGDSPDAARIEAERAKIAQLQALQQKRVLAQFLREREILTAQQREKLVQLLLRERQPAQRERELHGS
ncbi:periplasmic heavy metal sensor [Ramlibacter sp. RBP-2]|uniref:Periplasmic heavy metal sensor n=1 Tax=Ramlibacter lithotrophicus TaxID=2606681 RepID=A0A7X6DJU9_9BURK|nr:periplasmic heavy metal sensor [Ramlibacter lithotrophicus]NKE68495.1 periplasmic heavy metal sensor [Ramlibacter lithotrophicus]